MSNEQQSPRFDRNAQHMVVPRLRPVRGFPLEAQAPDGQTVQVLGLADQKQISERVVTTAPAVAMILPLMDGTRTLEQIAQQVGQGLSAAMLEPLIAQLDDAGLLEGPTFERMHAKVKANFDASDVLPPASSASFGDQLLEHHGKQDLPEDERAAAEKELMSQQLDLWIDQALKDAPDPAFATLPGAIVTPHLDYGRGWPNYAQVYGRMRVVDRPDRVVILGTNHFGYATGVCMCDKGYRTALGVSEVDGALAQRLSGALGPALLEHRFDHEHEHSIELQVPWIQHVFGTDETGAFPKVLGILVHDPSVRNGESYDGKGVAFEPFVKALREAIAAMPGRTLIVASADLSHVGPAFGDQTVMAGEEGPGAEARNEVVRGDLEVLKHLTDNKPEALVSSMAWRQNPTRWCSIGNLAAAAAVVQPKETRLLHFHAALDEQGMSMVTCAAMVMN